MQKYQHNTIIIQDLFYGIVLALMKPQAREDNPMGQLNTKFIVIGAMDGVPSEAIVMALRERGFEVVFCINQFFV